MKGVSILSKQTSHKKLESDILYPKVYMLTRSTFLYKMPTM